MKKHTKIFWILFGISQVALSVIVYVNYTKVSSAVAQIADQVLPVNCTFTEESTRLITGKVTSIKQKEMVAPSEYFPVEVQVQNTGNIPWFSNNSGCGGVIMNLGTQREADRKSAFFNSDPAGNWLAQNRIQMTTKRVDPNDTGSFLFWAKAPEQNGIYREYFGPVAEHIKWLDAETVFLVDINVGNVEPTPEISKYSVYINKSANLSTLNLEKGKSIEADLSEQKMYVKIGDFLVDTFTISTGKSSTPTPKGKFQILLKQEVRVAGAWPHYVMPNFMMFKKGGYGIHALPSLSNDHGTFWREALQHIGTPLSHGCMRLLPADSNFIWDFAEVGTPVTVRA